jgi:UDP-N-acetylglucosamine:LPS N-acetylglucosamine transferase
MIKKSILIATGGTGGHIFPAFSLANYLKEKNYTIKITSDKRGLRFLNNTKSFKLVNIPSSPYIKENILKFYFQFLQFLSHL